MKPVERVYSAKTSDQSREAYDTWSTQYDRDTFADGYQVPALGLAYIARHVPADSGPILDAACGTGLMGGLVRNAGYVGELCGSDLSPGMLEIAERTGAYDTVVAHELGPAPLPFPENHFAAVLCFGALGPGHAPASALDDFVRVTQQGGHIVLNVRSDTYEAQGLRAHIDRMREDGAWQIVDQSPDARAFLFTEPGVLVRVFVFRKT